MQRICLLVVEGDDVEVANISTIHQTLLRKSYSKRRPAFDPTASS